MAKSVRAFIGGKPFAVDQAIALGSLTGPFGAIHSRTDWPQACFDASKGGLYPVFHVLRGLARLEGTDILDTTISLRAKSRPSPSNARTESSNCGSPISRAIRSRWTSAANSPAAGRRFSTLKPLSGRRARPEFLDKVKTIPAASRMKFDSFAIGRIVSS
jgi:hypothetical protein